MADCRIIGICWHIYNILEHIVNFNIYNHDKEIIQNIVKKSIYNLIKEGTIYDEVDNM